MRTAACTGYPYYGPYRQFYYTRYRANYRPYHGAYVANGAYRSAPVRQGDARWDGDHRMLAPAYQRPGAVRPGQSGGQHGGSGQNRFQRQCGQQGEPACPNNSP
jgi:hypothetical protein